MIYSMTGFGRCQLNLQHANFNIEVKSLNSKQLDTNIKISSVYREKEIGLKNLLSTKLKRGKIKIKPMDINKTGVCFPWVSCNFFARVLITIIAIIAAASE